MRELPPSTRNRNDDPDGLLTLSSERPLPNLLAVLTGTSRLRVALIVGSSLLAGACATLLLAVVHRALNSSSSSGLLFPFIGLCVLGLLAGFTAHYQTAQLVLRKLHELRLYLSRLSLQLPFAHFETISSSRLYSALTEDIPSLSEGMAVATTIFTNLVTTVGAFVYLAVVGPKALLAWLTLVVASIPCLAWLIRIVRTRFVSMRAAFGNLIQRFDMLVRGGKELRLGREKRVDFFERGVAAACDDYSRHASAAYRVVSFAKSATSLVVFIALGFALFADQAWLSLAPSDRSAFVIITLYLVVPIANTVESLEILNRAAIALDELRKLNVALKQSLPDLDEVASRKIVDPAEVVLRDVSYVYEKTSLRREFKLGPISATFRPGTISFIVGGNGSGKSTLVKLVTGLYAPAEGEIFLGEHSITNDESQWYREHFAAVFSDFHLFDEFWGRDEASITEGVQSFIEAMELHKKVRLQGRQFSTTNLSSGERKRLALICAMIEARPVFVFDEWAADQDPRFRHIFYRVILPKLRDQNKTVIVVTHDDRYFDVADQLIKLDAGEQSLDQTASFMERLIGSQASG